MHPQRGRPDVLVRDLRSTAADLVYCKQAVAGRI